MNWHLKLNKASLTTKNKCSQLRNLATNDVFRNYFRGFALEKINGGEGQMAMLNFAAGRSTLIIKKKPLQRMLHELDKSIVINLTGSTVNLLNDVDSSPYSNAISSSSSTDGDAKLYLKGERAHWQL
jgi:hypothetical protein